MQEDAVRARLERLLRESGTGYAAASRIIGKNPAYLQQFVKRGVPRRLAETDRHRLARHFGVSERLLGAPDTFANHQEAENADESRRSEEKPYVLIPYLNPESGQPDDGAPKDALALDHESARSLSAGRPDALAAYHIRGDTMHPTLADGDRILIDTADTGLRDGIYALRSDSGPLIKRIGVNPITRRLSILSDNPAYPAIPDCDPQAIGIIGRVIWAGRRIV